MLLYLVELLVIFFSFPSLMSTLLLAVAVDNVRVMGHLRAKLGKRVEIDENFNTIL